MSLVKYLQVVLCCVLFLINSIVGLELCFEENFSGSLGVLNNPCTSSSPLLDVKKYSDFSGIVEKPSSSNDYFITNPVGVSSCVITGEGYDVVAGTELSLSVYSSNPGPPAILRWAVQNAVTGGSITSKLVYLDDSKTWQTSTIRIIRNAKIKIQIQCTDLDPNIFMAIDNVQVHAGSAEECPAIAATTVGPPTPQPTKPPTTVPNTDRPPTTLPNTDRPPTTLPNTDRPPTTLPNTDKPPTTLPNTDRPPTTLPNTDRPPTTLPNTNRPPTTDAITNNPTTDLIIPSTLNPVTELPPTISPEEFDEWKTVSIVALSIVGIELIYCVAITTFVLVKRKKASMYMI